VTLCVSFVSSVYGGQVEAVMFDEEMGSLSTLIPSRVVT